MCARARTDAYEANGLREGQGAGARRGPRAQRLTLSLSRTHTLSCSRSLALLPPPPPTVRLPRAESTPPPPLCCGSLAPSRPPLPPPSSAAPFSWCLCKVRARPRLVSAASALLCCPPPPPRETEPLESSEGRLGLLLLSEGWERPAAGGEGGDKGPVQQLTRVLAWKPSGGFC